MTISTIQAIQDQYKETQSLVMHVLEGLSPEQWVTQPVASAAPLAFHVWHIAREADILHVLLLEAMQQPAQQIWERNQLAARWQFPVGSLGLLQSGIGMDETDAALVPWPSQGDMMGYLRQAFGAVNDTMSQLPPDLPHVALAPQTSAVFGGAGTVERAIMRAIANGNRHLGIIGWLSTSPADGRYTNVPTFPIELDRNYAEFAGTFADR